MTVDHFSSVAAAVVGSVSLRGYDEGCAVVLSAIPRRLRVDESTSRRGCFANVL